MSRRIVQVLSVLVLFSMLLTGCKEKPIEELYPEVTLPSATVEKQKQNEEVRQALIEQGYPEEVVDTLLTQGAQRAKSLRNIASVLEEYGYPWNIPLHVGDYELVALHLIGNTDEDKFVLGQYDDATGEKSIFMHMSLTAPVSVLQASLSYSYEQKLTYATAYTDRTGKIVGFYFEVELEDENNSVLRYVATTSDSFSHEEIDSFISSVVDGKVKQIN